MDGRKRYDELFLAVKADRKNMAEHLVRNFCYFTMHVAAANTKPKSALQDMASQSSLKRSYYRRDELADDSDDDNDNNCSREDDEYTDEYAHEGNDQDAGPTNGMHAV